MHLPALDDHRLALLAMLVAAIGLLLLSHYANAIQPQRARISDLPALQEMQDGAYVEVTGFVRTSQVRSGNLFLNLCERSDCISVFVPSGALRDSAANPLLLKAGDGVLVRGQLQMYKGSLELVATGPNALQVI